jgi:nucleoside-diphosphate-sugar epimerase
LNILVTGATGFTGKNLLKYLLDNGKKVRVIVRDKSKLGELASHPNIDVLVGSISDKEIVDASMKGIKKVFHVAAIFRTSGIPDQVYWDTHVKGTELLMQAALNEGVERFVHTSTVGVHGDVGNEIQSNEQSPYSPGDIYQVTKLEAEKKVHEFYEKHGLPLVVIRPTAIYGPGDLRLLKLFKIASHKISLVIGEGKIKYHMVYIDDLIQGYMLASEVEEAIGEAFIIGGDEVLSLNELLSTISDVLNKSKTKIHLPVRPFQILGTVMEKIFIPLGISPPIYRRRVDFFTKSRYFDISKANKVLNFHPKTSVKEGIKKTTEWYKANGHLS